MKNIEPLHPITPAPQSASSSGAKPGHTFPIPESSGSDSTNPAADFIRQKLVTIYSAEPSAKEEANEVSHLTHRPSKHQQFMRNLTASGKPLAEVQTAWHAYYIGLSDSDKHDVWQEFYAAHNQSTMKQPGAETYNQPQPQPQAQPQAQSGIHIGVVADDPPPARRYVKKVKSRSVTDLKQELVGKVGSRNRSQRIVSHHVQSLIFGLSMGAVVMLILLFGFFNEKFIAPFITPSRNVSATPIILDPNSVAVGPEPKIIVPKINVEIPVVYDVGTIEEAAVEKGLERGVVHYASTATPGEKGNTVIFGHSSNNIINPGKYKFAFVLLNRMEPGDTFYLQKDSKRYAYRVFEKKIVQPSEVGVLDSVAGKLATATLITCDPPGTSLRRLVVVGEQISPDPALNGTSSAISTDSKPTSLAGNAPSLWSRITGMFR